MCVGTSFIVSNISKQGDNHLSQHLPLLPSVDSLLEDAGSFLSVRRGLRILLVLDCHHVEGVEGGEHRATHPRGILPVQGSSDGDFCLSVLACHTTELLIEAFIKLAEQSGTSGQHNVIVELDLEV